VRHIHLTADQNSGVASGRQPGPPCSKIDVGKGGHGPLPFYKNIKSNVKKTKVMKIVKNYEGLKIVINAYASITIFSPSLFFHIFITFVFFTSNFIYL